MASFLYAILYKTDTKVFGCCFCSAKICLSSKNLILLTLVMLYIYLLGLLLLANSGNSNGEKCCFKSSHTLPDASTEKEAVMQARCVAACIDEVSLSVTLGFVSHKVCSGPQLLSIHSSALESHSLQQ